MSCLSIGAWKLPAVWSRILPESVMAFELKAVQFSNCARCPLPPRSKSGPNRACCDYRPFYTNFLVGGMLEEESSPKITSWVRNGRGCPGWLHTPASDNGMCPLLSPEGLCEVYDHRYYLCSTWHCVYSSEEEMLLWRALLELLADSTNGSALFLMERLGIPYRDFLEIYNGKEQPGAQWWERDRIDEGLYKKMWGRWHGREEEFYRECFREISRMGDSFHREMAAFQEGVVERSRAACKLDVDAPESPPLYRKLKEGSEIMVVNDFNAKARPRLPEPIPELERRAVEAYKKWKNRAEMECP